MKLALYSDQDILENRKVDLALYSLIGKENPRIGYIPSVPDLARKYSTRKADYYKQYGLEEFVYFDLDVEYHPELLPHLLTCDAIHLSGGDTFHFLQSVRKRNFERVLKKYVQDGGVLVGISAGAILLTPDIETASVIDKNTAGLEDLTSLGLVTFGFFPHLNRDMTKIHDLAAMSRRKNMTIYACEDGDGIIVDGGVVRPIGVVVKVYDGVVERLAQ